MPAGRGWFGASFGSASAIIASTSAIALVLRSRCDEWIIALPHCSNAFSPRILMVTWSGAGVRSHLPARSERPRGICRARRERRWKEAHRKHEPDNRRAEDRRLIVCARTLISYFLQWLLLARLLLDANHVPLEEIIVKCSICLSVAFQLTQVNLSLTHAQRV